MNYIRTILFCALLFLTSCSNNETVAGGSTSVGNGFIAVAVAYKSTPVDVAVQLIPMNYNPITRQNGPIRVIHTGSNGVARFDSLPIDDYAVLVLEDTIGRYESSVPLNTTIDLELEKNGAITLNVDLVESLGISGTPFTGTVDTATGTMMLTNIPTGNYTGVVTDSVQTITTIAVESDKITEITVQQTLFTVSSVDLGASLSNFDISDISRGGSDILWAAADVGGLHRRENTTWEFIGAIHGIPSNEKVNGVRSSGSVPEGATSERVIVWGDQFYLFENGGWYNLNTGNPQFIGRSVNAAAMSRSGTAVLAFSDQVYYNIFHSDIWIPVNLSGVKSLFCDADTLWAGTESGLYAIALTGSMAVQMTNAFGTVHSIGKSSTGGIFAASDSGLIKPTGSSWERRLGTPTNLHFAASDNSGVIWAVQGEEYLVKFSSDGVIYRYYNPTIALTIRSVDGAPNGMYAAIGRNGIITIY